MNEIIQTVMIRKPSDLKSAMSQISDYEDRGDFKNVIVTAEKELSEDEYDQLANHFFEDIPWLGEENGGFVGGRYNSDTVKVIKVTCPGKPTLLINPEGYDYPRYVGILKKEKVAFKSSLRKKIKVEEKTKSFVSSLRKKKLNEVGVKGVFGTKDPDGSQVGKEYIDPAPAIQQTTYFNKRQGPGHKTFKEGSERRLAITWASNERAEQFFRTPKGYLNPVKWNNTPEDIEMFYAKLKPYSTFDSVEQASKWYEMIRKYCEDNCEIEDTKDVFFESDLPKQGTSEFQKLWKDNRIVADTQDNSDIRRSDGRGVQVEDSVKFRRLSDEERKAKFPWLNENKRPRRK